MRAERLQSRHRTLPVLRSYVGLGVLEAAGSTDTDVLKLVQCGVNSVVAGFSPDELYEIWTSDEPTDEFIDRNIEAGQIGAAPDTSRP